ncbi:MAG: peptide deformylase [Bacteroidales bacterium]|nr:peptide deformylase [Bacteroidales bacterium]
MKGKIILASCFTLATALLGGCSSRGDWTASELDTISSVIPGTDSLGTSILRVLTIADQADSLVLRTPCEEFTPSMLQSPEFEALSTLMLATVQDPSEDGVGIAGPQVGISRRIVAVQRFDKPGEPFEVYPNIRIVGFSGDTEPGPEGCLSVPGLRGDVMRYRDIDITYTLIGASADGQSNAALAPRDTTERVQGFTAVIFQHECDHLDGVLYIDKVIPGTLRESD